MSQTRISNEVILEDFPQDLQLYLEMMAIARDNLKNPARAAAIAATGLANLTDKSSQTIIRRWISEENHMEGESHE